MGYMTRWWRGINGAGCIELALVADLVFYLKKLGSGCEILGLSAYE